MQYYTLLITSFDAFNYILIIYVNMLISQRRAIDQMWMARRTTGCDNCGNLIELIKTQFFARLGGGCV